MVDGAQVRAIVVSSLMQQLRQKAGPAGRRGVVLAWLVNLALYLLAGFSLGIVCLRIADPFTGAFLSSSTLMVLTGVFVLMEFSTIATGPEDYLFYAPRPVSSATYFLAKLSVVLLYTLAFAAAFAAPLLALLAASGRPAAVVAGFAHALFLGAVTMSLLVVTLCGLLVRAVPVAAMRSAARWVQMLLFLAVYGGNAVIQGFFRSGAGGVSFDSPLFLLSPSAWGAAVLRMGGGGAWRLGAALSLAAPALFAWMDARILSPGYGAVIAEASAQPEAKRRAPAAAPRDTPRSAPPRGVWPTWIQRSPEEKAVNLLIATHFRHDSQFRLGVLAIVPVTLAYIATLLVGNRTPILDPFTAAGRQTFGPTFLLYTAVGIFPFYLKNALSGSAQAEAAWIYHASPADKLLLLRASRRFILSFFLLPYLAVLAVAFAALTGSVPHAVQHFLVILLLCLMETDWFLLFFPELPFSRKARLGRRSNRLFLQVFVALAALAPLFLFVYFVYPTPWTYPVAAAGLFLLYRGLHALGVRTARRKLARAELAG